MPLTRLIALKSFPYQRLKLSPDQEFAANPHAARLLTRIGLAKYADAGSVGVVGHPGPVGVDGSHDVTIADAISGPPAASERVVVPPGEEARPMTTQTIRQKPGKYKRKDLEAES